MSSNVADIVAGEEQESSSEELILPRPRKRPRVANYLSISELLTIFPDEEPGTLATLAEAHESSIRDCSADAAHLRRPTRGVRRVS